MGDAGLDGGTGQPIFRSPTALTKAPQALVIPAVGNAGYRMRVHADRGSVQTGVPQ